MFGLIAPTLDEGARSREVFLPRGGWFKFSLNDHPTKIKGGVVVDVTVSLDEIAIFVRDNSIIPVCKKTGRNVYDSMSSGIKFLTFGNNSSGDLYIDDGISLAYQAGTCGYYTIDKNGTCTVAEGMDYLNSN